MICLTFTMTQPRSAAGRPRGKANFTRIPLGWVALVAGVLLLNWAITAYLRNGKPQVDEAAIKAQAIARAEQAVRTQVGDSLAITFPATPEVEGGKVYTVRSQFVSTGRRGEQHKRSWIVTLEFKGGPPTDSTNWKLLSCDIGK